MGDIPRHELDLLRLTIEEAAELGARGKREPDAARWREGFTVQRRC